MEPGESWAYRAAPYHGAVSEVEVLKVGTQRPLRVKVRFVADDEEGREEWVPPVRLRVPWQQRDEWLERQLRWDELTRDGPGDEDAEFLAASLVFDECSVEDVVSMGWNYRERGVLYVDDVPALAAMLDVPEDFFVADPRAIVDDAGAATAPWPTTLAVARLLARSRAESLAAVLAEEEERTRRRAVYGEYYRGRGKNPGTHISPEICAEVDRIHKPGRDLVRQWCGSEAVDNLAELKALRAEVVRIGKLMEEAIRSLREAGQPRVADKFERQLGVPLEVLRHVPGGDAHS
ncbi:hypothetical protein SAMN06272775_4635 [Streptomyces sp. 2323.1]|uniref:hypothetical protein n=1 Tax=Streptomyces sp. 2323.1 TaxID=1938841 RepID=UPI000BB6D7A3|nr:hypothetical protein [Streptomyces sp. 2323.1]SOE13658.1 hypothetical protein SAMN06272775_4635 [Streptomyces sp. 2323.1]